MIPVLLAFAVLNVSAALKAPVVSYRLRIDPADLSAFNVTMEIRNAPPTLRLAMAWHPEYNDRFWRYIRDLRAESGGAALSVSQQTENTWLLNTRAGSATLHYRIQLPSENPTSRAVWHSALKSTGASINAMDTFVYLPDFAEAPVQVTLEGPESWKVATGLTPDQGKRVYTAPNAFTFLESPILFGDIRSWSFAVNGTPHHVAYWPLPDAAPFDTLELVSSIQKLARQAIALFGKAPYREFTFLLEDGAFGGLEHVNSVSIGAKSTNLARDPRAEMEELAHEYLHTWNLVALNPRGLGTVSTTGPTPTRELWWSEGMTMYYVETLLRRAGISERGQTRLQELEQELNSFYGNSGNSYLSPERGSWASIGPADANGDYIANYYTQGRLIGDALDIIIADSTRGRRGMDDVMRLMYDRFAKKRAFTGTDIERAADDVCKCNLHRFFEDHVRSAKPIDFNRHLSALGLRVVLDTVPVADTTGRPLPDLRISVYSPLAVTGGGEPMRGAGRMRVRIFDPRTVWRSAGLHTGTELVSLKGVPIDSFPDFRRVIRSIKLGDIVPVSIIRDGTPTLLNVRVTGYDRVRARVVDSPNVTAAQRERRRLWLSATPVVLQTSSGRMPMPYAAGKALSFEAD